MKLAEIGDIVQDNFKKVGTVIGSTTTSLTVKYDKCTEKTEYNKTVISLESLRMKRLETHERVIALYSSLKG